MKRTYTLMLLFCGMMILYSCSKYRFNQKSIPALETEWLIPLAKGQFGFEDIRELSNINSSYLIPAMDIGFVEGVQVNVPALDIPQVGPYKQALSDWIQAIQFDSLNIRLGFNNLFPIAIGQGTAFTFRNSADTNSNSNIIYSHTISQQINPTEQYSFDVVIGQNQVSDTIYIYLEHFKSPGGTVTFATTPCQLSVELKVVDLKKVSLYPDKSLRSYDTIDVEWGEQEEDFEDTLSSARINIYMENAMPLNQYLQIYFLEPNSSVIYDSLFTAAINLSGCQTDQNGTPLNTTQSQSVVDISLNKIRRIRQCRQIVLNYDLNTLGYPQPLIHAGEQTFFKLQLSGDLKLHLKLD